MPVCPQATTSLGVCDPKTCLRNLTLTYYVLTESSCTCTAFTSNYQEGCCGTQISLNVASFTCFHGRHLKLNRISFSRISIVCILYIQNSTNVQVSACRWWTRCRTARPEVRSRSRPMCPRFSFRASLDPVASLLTRPFRKRRQRRRSTRRAARLCSNIRRKRLLVRCASLSKPVEHVTRQNSNIHVLWIKSLNVLVL